MLEQFIAFLQKNPYHLMLFGTAVVTGGMLIWPLFGRMIRPGKEVSAVEAVQLINRRDAVVLDVRTAAEYAGGHITGARNIPEAQLAERVKELERFKARPIVVSCASGARSVRAIAVLQKHGFTEVVNLRGGMGAWQQAGMPLEK
jgi:rhodanese-related sulfurtransferase